MKHSLGSKNKDLEEGLINHKTHDIDAHSNAYLKYAFFAAFFFGTSNFLSGELSSRLGPAGGYPFFIGNLLSWMTYHLIAGI